MLPLTCAFDKSLLEKSHPRAQLFPFQLIPLTNDKDEESRKKEAARNSFMISVFEAKLKSESELCRFEKLI